MDLGIGPELGSWRFSRLGLLTWGKMKLVFKLEFGWVKIVLLFNFFVLLGLEILQPWVFYLKKKASLLENDCSSFNAFVRCMGAFFSFFLSRKRKKNLLERILLILQSFVWVWRINSFIWKGEFFGQKHFRFFYLKKKRVISVGTGILLNFQLFLWIRRRNSLFWKFLDI